jgi:hypothetical protein
MKLSGLLKSGAPALALLALSQNCLNAAIVNNNMVPNGTYVFSATDGNMALDGSTVTFLNDAIASWDLQDITVAPGLNLPPLTPVNSSIVSSFIFGQTAFGSLGWFFDIASPVGVTSTNASTFWFQSQNDLSAPGVGGGTATLYDGFGNGPAYDPVGNWNLAAPGPNQSNAPDGASTLLLCTGALAALRMAQTKINRNQSER